MSFWGLFFKVERAFLMGICFSVIAETDVFGRSDGRKGIVEVCRMVGMIRMYYFGEMVGVAFGFHLFLLHKFS